MGFVLFYESVQRWLRRLFLPATEDAGSEKKITPLSRTKNSLINAPPSLHPRIQLDIVAIVITTRDLNISRCSFYCSGSGAETL
jgi:hypothetical protein